jgi:acetyl esterase/lipase
LLERLQQVSTVRPHPHLAAGPELGDQATRLLGVLLPLSWQHSCRDSGTFRSISDSLVTASVPLLALAHPGAAINFWKLTQRVQRLHYGPHERHVMDVFLPEKNLVCGVRRMIFFVHGGAWGR